MLYGNSFYSLGAEQEKAQSPALDIVLGTVSKFCEVEQSERAGWYICKELQI